MRVHSIIATAAFLSALITGCAKPGYHYETGDFFTQTSNDACLHNDVHTALVESLHKTAGMAKADFQTISTSRNHGFTGNYMCHGTLVLENGRTIPGTISLNVDANRNWSGAWESDADRDAREHKAEQAINDRYARWANAHPGYSQTDYDHQLDFCATYRGWAMAYYSFKRKNISKPRALDILRSQSADYAMRTDPLTALDAENLQVRLLDAAYTTHASYDDFSNDAYVECMDHGGL